MLMMQFLRGTDVTRFFTSKLHVAFVFSVGAVTFLSPVVAVLLIIGTGFTAITTFFTGLKQEININGLD